MRPTPRRQTQLERAEWGAQLLRMTMFDNLIGNRGEKPAKHAPRPGVEPDPDRSLTGVRARHRTPPQVDPDRRGYWAKIEGLTRSQLDAALRPWLDADEIRAILDRREKMRAEIRSRAEIGRHSVAASGHAVWPMTTKTIAHYEILAPIGEGGMGVVYRALDTRLGRPVALKLLRPDGVVDAESRKRFVQEARAASALNHPHIITIYDIGQAEGVDFIAMEYIAGSSLAQVIRQRQAECQRRAGLRGANRGRAGGRARCGDPPS